MAGTSSSQRTLFEIAEDLVKDVGDKVSKLGI